MPPHSWPNHPTGQGVHNLPNYPGVHAAVENLHFIFFNKQVKWHVCVYKSLFLENMSNFIGPHLNYALLIACVYLSWPIKYVD